MLKQQNNTKKGAAAIYIVIFTATLLGIITLSFVRLMLAESMRTTNYSLSQSAYNSALAGIEDAKIVLLRYQNCVNSGSTFTSGVECGDYVDAFNSLNSATNAEDCDLVRNLLGYNTPYNVENHETLIQTNTSDTISAAGAAFDQAYTCVKINQKSSNYITTLTENYPTKIVPVRTGNADDPESHDHVNYINRISISWFNRKNVEKVSLDGQLDRTNYNPTVNTKNITSANFNSFIAFSDSNTNPYYNTFGAPSDPNDSSAHPTAPPTIQMTLIQTAEAFKLSQFYSNSGNDTNRGTLTLRPVSLASGESITSTHIGNNALAMSANKSQNSPIDVTCDIENEELEYSCVADITIPKPKMGFAFEKTGKVNEHYRKFDATSSFAYHTYDVEVCSEISSDGTQCTKTKKRENQKIALKDIEPQSPGTKLEAVSGAGSYKYTYVVCTEFNTNGSCKSTDTKTMENGTASPSNNINGISSPSENQVNKYEFQICTKLTSYIACETGMMKTMSYEGTVGPQNGSALKYTRDSRTRVVSYQFCEEYNPDTGACSQYSSKVQTYTGNAPSTSLRNPSSLSVTNLGKKRYAFKSCSSLKADATCNWTAMSYTGTAAPSYTVTINKVTVSGKQKIYSCSGFSQTTANCSNWELTTQGYGSTLYYYGPTPTNKVTNIQGISNKKTYYTYTYVECNESYGYSATGECNRWGTTKKTIEATEKPKEYRTVTKTQTFPASQNRNPNTTFIVLNSPYGLPETEVSVQLLHCASESTAVSDCEVVNFANVQPIIDSTGRANDLFRRVEARIELVDTYFPIANFALAADEDGHDNDNIKKDFYVTKCCNYIESYPTVTDGVSSVHYTPATDCVNAGDRSDGIKPSMNP